jgi:cytochrome P450
VNKKKRSAGSGKKLCPAGCGNGLANARRNQKFFASFFQKRSACFLWRGNMQFNFDNPAFRADPYPAYRMLRTMAPMMRMPEGFWVISSHAGCSALLRDANFGHGDDSKIPSEFLEEPAVKSLRRMMLLSDPPAHTRLRGLVAKAFSARRIEALRPRILEIVDGLIDGVIGQGRMEVMADFAKKLPVTVICDMLGIPEGDRAMFYADTEVRGRLLDPVAISRADLDVANRATLESQAYFKSLFAYRRKNPGDDLTTALLAARENDDALSDEEILANISLLFAAGHETTTNLIGNGILALQRNFSEWEKLLAMPSLIPNAVEELLRYDSPVQLTGRRAVKDCEVMGQRVAANEQVIVLLGAANRDPAAHAGDPEMLDVGRMQPRPLSFGGGIHFCLGAPLARMEGEVALGRLLERVPGLRVVDLVGVEWKPTVTLRGPVRLEAVW